MIALRIENAREVEKVLERLARDFGGLLPLRSAAQAALEPALDDARATTPVRTGALRRSARLAVSVEQGQVVGRVGWSGRGVRRQQMLAVEFGTAHQPARRVLSRAFEAARVDAAFERLLRREIDAALARAVRPPLRLD